MLMHVVMYMYMSASLHTAMVLLHRYKYSAHTIAGDYSRGIAHIVLSLWLAQGTVHVHLHIGSFHVN